MHLDLFQQFRCISGRHVEKHDRPKSINCHKSRLSLLIRRRRTQLHNHARLSEHMSHRRHRRSHSEYLGQYFDDIQCLCCMDRLDSNCVGDIQQGVGRTVASGSSTAAEKWHLWNSLSHNPKLSEHLASALSPSLTKEGRGTVLPSCHVMIPTRQGSSNYRLTCVMIAQSHKSSS